MKRRTRAARLSVAAFAASVAALLLPPSDAAGRVVLNEVLYDPEGSDTGLEFVELLNCGHLDALLTGWVLETGNGANPDDWTVEWIGGEFDIIHPGETFLIGEVDVTPAPDYATPLDLQNGPDGVRLTDGERVVDVVGWGEPLFDEYYEGAPAADAPSGSSLARSPDCYDNDDNSRDFVVCGEPTPGTRNAFRLDAAIEARHSGRTIFDASRPVTLSCTVLNEGSHKIAAGECIVDVFCDGAAEPLAQASVDTALSPRDSVDVELVLDRPEPGYHTADMVCRLSDDADESDNLASTSFTVGRIDGFVAVNEIMFSPAEGCSEWLELVNVSEDTVSLVGWSVGDDTDAVAIEGGAGHTSLSPGDYLVVADRAEGVAGAASPVVETDGWEALSADDVTVLLDSWGTCVERVPYTDDWGGGRGVSLERVRPDLDPGERTNWGSSVATEGATPGGPNSIRVGDGPACGELTAGPNPFTPDGDGEDDRTVVSFNLPVARALARLTVFDSRGRERARFLDGEAVSGSGELIWDGRDDEGEPLPTGLYVLLLEAIDAPRGVLVTARTAVALVR